MNDYERRRMYDDAIRKALGERSGDEIEWLRYEINLFRQESFMCLSYLVALVISSFFVLDFIVAVVKYYAPNLFFLTYILFLYVYCRIFFVIMVRRSFAMRSMMRAVRKLYRINQSGLD